jgi:hypothetical protein
MAVVTTPTDALLVQATLPAGARARLPQWLDHLRTALQDSPWPGLSVQVHGAFNEAQSLVYAYLHLDKCTLLEPSVAAWLQTMLNNHWPELRDLRVSRLEKMLDKRGASAATAAVFHYVVEMDPEAGWLPELSSWYDTEHMPGLALVPGCVSARRYVNHDHGPLSLACYDLVTQETLGSPPWLAIRETEWSSRMRPRFTNTLRTMFDVMGDTREQR